MYLRRVPIAGAIDATALPEAATLSIPALLRSDAIDREWDGARRKIGEVFGYENRDGALSPLGCRAVWYLIRRLEPRSVMEIGTHVGGSTLHIAMALRACSTKARLITVDRYDVNDDAGPWKQCGLVNSPKDMIARLDCADVVEFASAMSLDYLSGREAEFDFIFLDGSHRADIVYREIPLALKALRPGGRVLMHDYFPRLKPLWTGGRVIPGPCLAVERLRREGVGLTVVPFGALPWPTKSGSTVSSLALLARE